jgi:hypothetical protein
MNRLAAVLVSSVDQLVAAGKVWMEIAMREGVAPPAWNGGA